MTTQVPGIEQLKELGLPAPVSYMPQTWGWWLLLGLLVSAALLFSARRYWQWRRDRYRREALARFEELQNSDDQLAALRELPELLKRVALSMLPVGASLLVMASGRSASVSNDTPSSRASPLPQVAPLSGEAWQAFLVQHSPRALPADFSRQLAQLAYAPDATLLALPTAQRQQLFDICKLWVEHHHVAA